MPLSSEDSFGFEVLSSLRPRHHLDLADVTETLGVHFRGIVAAAKLLDHGLMCSQPLDLNRASLCLKVTHKTCRGRDWLNLG